MNEKILAMGKQCVSLAKSKEQTATFLGSQPVVGSKIDWPRKDGKPLTFIAQIALEEVNSNKKIDWLPKIGRLLFFYDMERMPWGFDPKDRGSWVVIYENGQEDFQQVEIPNDLNLNEWGAPLKKYLKAEDFLSLPSDERLDFKAVGLNDDEEIFEKYWDYLGEYYGESPNHQIDGFPRVIQGDGMEEDCQLVSGGVYMGNAAPDNPELALKLKNEKNDWRLLFQYDSDDDAEVMWGDLGTLYFWVRESDAQNLDFSNVWLKLQCG